MSSEICAPYIGVKPAISTRSSAPSNTELIHGYVQSGYSYVLMSITNTQYRERSKKAFQRAKVSSDLEVACPGSQDVNILSGPHIQNTIGLLASWIDLENVNELIAEFSRQVLFHELEYAKFIGLKHIIIAPPKDLLRLSRFSSTIQEMLRYTEQQNIAISISLPICEEFENDSLDPLSTWDMWNSIRTSVDYNPRLKVSLALTKNGLPMAVVNRWFAEPISCVLISSSIFLINNKGYPVLSKPNQQVLHIFRAKSPIMLLHGLEKAPASVDPASYLQYLDYLMVKNKPELSNIGRFGARYNDVLLPPLQPLHNNLDDFTYNIFEQDEVKYDLYGKAIGCALSELSHLSKINVAIAGAGKGGLVEAAFNAVQMLKLQGKCHITAIEKNNSAVLYLDQRNHLDWDSSVQILNMDMRQWSPKESYNIIISELLGSFGCNELSPECLKPLEQQLDRENGVFIPQSYTSYLAPVFTPKLHQILKSQKDTSAFHKQYVVKLLEVTPCSNKVNDLWTFTHPSITASFKKTSISTFKIRHKTVIHGLAGYFTAKLYKDIEISIRPDTHTTDLISWFPLFFPLEQPLYCTDDTELEVSMARECRGSKVWYSWSLESFMYLVVPGDHSNELQVRVRTNVSKIHNDGGEGFAVDQEIS